MNSVVLSMLANRIDARCHEMLGSGDYLYGDDVHVYRALKEISKIIQSMLHPEAHDALS